MSIEISSMRLHLYNKAKSAKKGETVVCPYCGKKFIKKSYNQVFCTNAKTKSARNCKDMFWNKVDTNKKCRLTPYYYDKIAIDRDDRDDFEDDHPFSMEATNWGGCKE